MPEILLERSGIGFLPANEASRIEAEKLSSGQRIRVKIREEGRSIDQNGLYWQWLTILAKYFSKGSAEYSKDDIHDICRHKFLGYEDRKIGNTEIRAQLKSTARLDKGEMHHYLTQVDNWAVEMGCLLPHPEDSQYAQYREAQNK